MTWLINPVRISVFHWLWKGWSPNGNYPYLVNGFSSVDLKGEMGVGITLRSREMTQHPPSWYTGEAHVRNDPWLAGVGTVRTDAKALNKQTNSKVSRNSRNKSILPLLFLLCLSGIIQCKLLSLKVQFLDNNRWRYVTSATIYELKEKIISNITSLYYKVQWFKIMRNSYSQLFKICSINTFYAFSQRK